MAYGTQEILIVEMAGQPLGLSGKSVRELLRAVYITPLPVGQTLLSAARFIEGVISLRGEIVPVLDLRQWLGLPPKPVDPADHLVVMRDASVTAVLRVDRALELTRLDLQMGEGDKVGLVGRASARSEGGLKPALRTPPRHLVAISPSWGLVIVPELSSLLALGKSFLESETATTRTTEATPS